VVRVYSDNPQAYRRSEAQKKLLKETLNRVRKLVKEHAGPQCVLEDISMHTYSSHVHDAPFEFAIVVSLIFVIFQSPSPIIIKDKSRPDGVSPDEDRAKLPVVYDPRCVYLCVSEYQ